MSTNTPIKGDVSEDWETYAEDFIAIREQSVIGVDVVRAWSYNLPQETSILDLGCGIGVPIASALIEEGFRVFGIDASPTMVAAFNRQFTDMKAICEPVESSTYFDRKFKGIVAIGLIFLLPNDIQRQLIHRISSPLEPKGHLLFSAPNQVCEWVDLTTGRTSRSLGEDTYIQLLSSAGLTLVDTYVDDGDNFYYHAMKVR